MDKDTEYLRKLELAKKAWECYTDPKSLEPIMMLMDVVCEPAFKNDKRTAQLLLPTLVHDLYNKSLITRRSLTRTEYRYIGSVTPERYRVSDDVGSAMDRWAQDILKNWDTGADVSEYTRVLRYVYETTVLRWYKTRSCENYRGVVIRLLNDALEEAGNYRPWRTKTRAYAASDVVVQP